MNMDSMHNLSRRKSRKWRFTYLVKNECISVFNVRKILPKHRIKFSGITSYCNHINLKVDKGLFKELSTTLTKDQIMESQLE